MVTVVINTLFLNVQESTGVPERDEAAVGHVSLSTQGAEGQSPAHGCREEGQVRGDQYYALHNTVLVVNLCIVIGHL